MGSKTFRGLNAFVKGVRYCVGSTINRSVDLTADVVEGVVEVGSNIVKGEFKKIPKTVSRTAKEALQDFRENTADMRDGAVDSLNGAVAVIKGVPQDIKRVTVKTGGKIARIFMFTATRGGDDNKY